MNDAEISSADNSEGLPDVDSVPDGTQGNDAGGAPDTTSTGAPNATSTGANIVTEDEN